MQPSFAVASTGKETAITAVRIITASGVRSHLRFSSAHPQPSPLTTSQAVFLHYARSPIIAPPPPRLARLSPA